MASATPLVRYRALVRATAAFLALVFSVGIGSGAAPRAWVPHGELFPFFSWFLFWKTPSSVERYAVRIVAVGDARFDPPTWFEDSGSRVVRADSIIAQRLVQRIGEAAERGDSEDLERLRMLFEVNHLREGTRYELVRVRFDPLDRWRGGTLSGDTVARFETGE